MLEKARDLPCDVVVLDLEDSVAPEAKNAARDAVCAAVKTYGRREVVVRINRAGTQWHQADLNAVPWMNSASGPTNGVVIPISSAMKFYRLNRPLRYAALRADNSLCTSAINRWSASRP